MAAPHDPTELAAIESDTQSVQAWGLEDWGDEPVGRVTPGRVVAAAVAGSLLVVVVAGAVAWQHLQVVVPTAETSTMVPATVQPTITAVAKPPPPLPPPPPVTVTTVIQQIPDIVPSVPSTGPIPDDVIAFYDRQFVQNLINHGWYIDDRIILARNAHSVCYWLERGLTPAQTTQKVFGATTAADLNTATQLTQIAMATYPRCP